jgi:hypothetical protein
LARAKRTDRAEARRRHRAATAAVEGDSGLQASPAPAAAGPAPARSSSGTTAMSSPSGRLPMGTAFRQAFHPVDIRADLAALPWLAVHTKALWVPILITLAGTAAIAIASTVSVQNTIVAAVTALIFQYFIQPPAIGGVFIAGFLAPRASWLLGIIVGLVAAAAYTFILYVFPTAIFGATAPDPNQVRDLAMSGFLLSPVFGALFASGAAWYRRFLQLSNPNRGRRAEAKKKPNDGKSRTSGRDQKAGARR